MLRWSIQLILAVAVMALTVNMLSPHSVWYGQTMHPYVTYGIIGAAMLVPLFWAVAHLGMGIVMGISGGGLVEGLRLGLILGLGMALGRCWLNVAAVAGGIAIAGGPLFWAVVTGVLALLLLGLNWVMHYIWRQHQPLS
jgi:hypothetical protein